MSVVAAGGFRAAGVAAGISGQGGTDLALVVGDGPCVAAGVFADVGSAPALWSQQVLTTGTLRAVVLTSGCANSGTGPEGFQTTHATAERAAESLGGNGIGIEVGAIEVAVCSTGPAGPLLPRAAVLDGVAAAAAALAADLGAGHAAAAAVDGRESAHLDAAGWTAGGFAAPGLAVLTTDAVADAAQLRAVLAGLGPDAGTVLVLASGVSGVAAEPAALAAALTAVLATTKEPHEVHSVRV